MSKKESYLTQKQKEVVQDEKDATVREGARQRAKVLYDKETEEARQAGLAADDLAKRMDAAARARDDAAREATAAAAERTFWQRFKDYLAGV